MENKNKLTHKSQAVLCTKRIAQPQQNSAMAIDKKLLFS